MKSTLKTKKSLTNLVRICICIFMVLEGLSCCTSNIEPKLKQAEGLLSTAPDSAYTILSSINHPKDLSELEYATWCLLITQAIDKSYRDHTTDSLIHIAVRYFSKHRDKDRLATALYTRGRVERELKMNDKASRSFIEALDLLEGSDKYKLQYLVSSQIGHLYAYSHMADKAFDAYKQCLDFANQAKDSTSIAYANAYIGRVYGLQKNWDESKKCYKQAINIAQKVNSILPLRLALNELAATYAYTSQYDSTYYYLTQLLKLPNTPQDNTSIYLNIGNICRLTDNFDLAIHHLNKALNTSNMYTKKSTYECLAYLHEEDQNYKKAIEYYKLFTACNDSILKIENRKNLAEVEQKYQNEKLKSSLQKAVFGGITLLFIIVFIILINMWKHKKEILKYYEEIENIRTLIKENEEKISQYKDKIKRTSLDKEQLKLELNSEIQNLIRENQELKEQKSNLYAQLSKSQENLVKHKKIEEREGAYPEILIRIEKTRSLDNSEWEDLFIIINAMHNQFTKRIKANYPQITNNELIIYCLLKLGYSRKEISDILDISEDAVQKRLLRSRVHFHDHEKWRRGEFEEFIKNYKTFMSLIFSILTNISY